MQFVHTKTCTLGAIHTKRTLGAITSTSTVANERIVVVTRPSAAIVVGYWKYESGLELMMASIVKDLESLQQYN